MLEQITSEPGCMWSGELPSDNLMPACLLVILSHHAGRKEHDKKEEMFWQCSLATGEYFVFETVISCKSRKQIMDVGHFLFRDMWSHRKKVWHISLRRYGVLTGYHCILN